MPFKDRSRWNEDLKLALTSLLFEMQNPKNDPFDIADKVVKTKGEWAKKFPSNKK